MTEPGPGLSQEIVHSSWHGASLTAPAGACPWRDDSSTVGRSEWVTDKPEENAVPRIVPNLWFDDQALEAAEFYVSIFPNSKITTVTHYTEVGPGPEGEVLTVDFELDGQKITGINGGPLFTFSEAVSLLIEAADQNEIDHYWEKLTDGGEESQCGWLKDRYGFSWQVVPKGWEALYTDPDTEKVNRVMTAMLQMKKLDIAALEAAAGA